VTGIKRKKVSFVLDADVRGFFDAIDHAWLMKFIKHRIADQRVIRHLQKWLNAGVLEDGQLTRAEEGTPQGGSVSPLLANIYLHYVFDLWADKWRRQAGRGDVTSFCRISAARESCFLYAIDFKCRTATVNPRQKTGNTCRAPVQFVVQVDSQCPFNPTATRNRILNRPFREIGT
jgi:retron-type reverse transcriptase